MATYSETLTNIAPRHSTRAESFLAGVREVLPITLSVVPFGMVCGVGALESGMSQAQAMLFSFAVFAGSSQIITTEFIASGAPTLIIVLAALAVNLRFLMYSATISPYFARYSVPLKLLVSYLLTDQAFAMSINAYNDKQRSVARLPYYFGAALCLLLTFQLGNLIGVLLGTAMPRSLGLDFCVPLVFLALMIPALKNRSMYVAAAVAGLLTLALLWLPYMLGVFAAALVAIFAGYLHLERTSHDA